MPRVNLRRWPFARAMVPSSTPMPRINCHDFKYTPFLLLLSVKTSGKRNKCIFWIRMNIYIDQRIRGLTFGHSSTNRNLRTTRNLILTFRYLAKQRTQRPVITASLFLMVLLHCIDGSFDLSLAFERLGNITWLYCPIYRSFVKSKGWLMYKEKVQNVGSPQSARRRMISNLPAGPEVRSIRCTHQHQHHQLHLILSIHIRFSLLSLPFSPTTSSFILTKTDLNTYYSIICSIVNSTPTRSSWIDATNLNTHMGTL